MAVYCTADLHFWHANIIRYCNRPYATVEEMNEALIENWNETVGPEDSCYVLGDFAFAIRAVETITPRLNGKKYLVPGNHDWCHSYHKKSRKSPEHQRKWINTYERSGWTVLPEQHRDPALGRVLMCHLPYAGLEPGSDKYVSYRPENKGEWLLCGHVHDKWTTRPRTINVGCDVWDYRPVSATALAAIMETTDGKTKTLHSGGRGDGETTDEGLGQQ